MPGINENEKQMKYWRNQIEKRKNSGMTVNEYCKTNKISRTQYYCWQRKINACDNEDDKSTFVKLDMEELKASDDSEKECNEISASIYWNNLRIDIYNNTNKEVVKTIFEGVIKYVK